MKDLLRAHAIQIIIIFITLLLFLANVTGLLEFTVKPGPIVSVRTWQAEAEFNYLSRLFQSPDFLLLLVSGLILAVMLPVLSPIKASLLALVCVVPPVLINLMEVTRPALVPMEYSLLTILVLYSMHVLTAYFRETHSRQKIIAIFGQYVPPDVVAEISKHPGQISMEGESRRLTVLFCDLQNFTGTAEQLNPKQLAALLNEYLSAMSEILFNHGATIDKYIGDSIMAFWGAPLPQPDHARRSILAAFAMHEKIEFLSEQFIKKGWPGPKMGIGINTGMMNVGNMGSRYRLAYTVVGDAVNLGSRLEGLTRVYNVSTIISESVMTECNGIMFRELDLVHVKGKHKAIRIYQPVCLQDKVDNTLHRQLKDHAQGLDYYYKERWDDAKAVFKQLAMERREDGYYPVMLSKIDEMLKQ